MRLTTIGLKGGTGKTTSAVFLACALAADEQPVLLIDADPQGSAATWAEAAPTLPYATVSVASPAVARQARDLGRRYKHLVIDTPPGHPNISTAALAAADVALVPLSTGSVDLLRFTATVELIQAVRDTGNEALQAFVLLTKTRAGTSSRRDVRAALTDASPFPVLDAEIPLREAIGAAEGTDPSRQLDAYQAAADELLAATLAGAGQAR